VTRSRRRLRRSGAPSGAGRCRPRRPEWSRPRCGASCRPTWAQVAEGTAGIRPPTPGLATTLPNAVAALRRSSRSRQARYQAGGVGTDTGTGDRLRRPGRPRRGRRPSRGTAPRGGWLRAASFDLGGVCGLILVGGMAGRPPVGARAGDRLAADVGEPMPVSTGSTAAGIMAAGARRRSVRLPNGSMAVDGRAWTRCDRYSGGRPGNQVVQPVGGDGRRRGWPVRPAPIRPPMAVFCRSVVARASVARCGRSL
jgi:hypothetical protein